MQKNNNKYNIDNNNNHSNNNKIMYHMRHKVKENNYL